MDCFWDKARLWPRFLLGFMSSFLLNVDWEVSVSYFGRVLLFSHSTNSAFLFVVFLRLCFLHLKVASFVDCIDLDCNPQYWRDT